MCFADYQFEVGQGELTRLDELKKNNKVLSVSSSLDQNGELWVVWLFIQCSRKLY